MEIRITLEHVNGIEYYRGQVINDKGVALYTTTRMSQMSIRQALTSYILGLRKRG